VDVHTKTGALRGVMGRLPIHLIDRDERKSVTKIEKLFIDLGLPVKQVKDLVTIGDPVTYGVGFEVFGDGMAVSRAFDDKVGAFICARVLQEVHRAGGSHSDLIAAATVQEELGLRGGHTSAYGVDPAVGIALAKKLGDQVAPGEPLATLLMNDVGPEPAESLVQAAYRIGPTPPTVRPLVLGEIR
jgi:putative aminopeptidase FrvX